MHIDCWLNLWDVLNDLYWFRPFQAVGATVTNRLVDKLCEKLGFCFMRTLLAVSVMIALLDESHTKHESMSTWLANHIGDGWVSYPLNQNGRVRVPYQASFLNSLSIDSAVDRLRSCCVDSTSPVHCRRHHPAQ